MAELTHKKLTPDFKVVLKGVEITQAEPNGLVNLVVEDHVDMMGMAQITLNTNAGEKSPWGDIAIGDDVECHFGGGDKAAFKGLVTGKRHSWQAGKAVVTLTALDPTTKLASSRNTRTFEEMTDSEIFEQVIGEAGLETGTVDSTSGKSPHVVQRNESDLEFVKRLASRNGYQVNADAGQINFIKPSFQGDTIEIPASKLSNMDFEFTDQQIPTELTVIGWDPVTKAKVEGTATKADIEKMGSGEGAVDKAGPIWSGKSFITDVQVASQDAAKLMAIGELNRLARGFMKGRATVNGTGEVRAGCTIKLTGQHKGMAAEGYVISVRHTLEPGGLHSSQIIFSGNTHTVDQ